MDIAYASDDNFAVHMAASICSVMQHNREEDITFHILSDGISEEKLGKITDMIEKGGQKACLYPLGDFEGKLRALVPGMNTGDFHVTTLARLFLGSILPASVKTVLYLDCDTVVLHSLEVPFLTRMDPMVAAMAPEPTIYPAVKELIGLSDADIYYNAGVMLLNLSLWRRENLEAECLHYYQKMNGKLPFNDQDILNHVLRDRVYTLGQRFNFFSNYYYFSYAALCRLSPSYRTVGTERLYRISKHHPVVVHFAGAERPWNEGSLNYYRRAYEKYLAETPFYDTPKVKGQKLSMLFYHGMNVLTFLCPAARKKISDLYYRKHFGGVV